MEGALDIIYRTLEKTGLIHDEGPDKDGGYGPYVQSERNASGVYLKYAKQLVEQGDAYYCFCDKARLDSLKTSVSEDGTDIVVYDKHCLGLSKEEVEANLAAGKPWVIRLNVPNEGTTTFHDEIYGDITVPNAELDDMILIKSDGFPTYNFANVIDDHLIPLGKVNLQVLQTVFVGAGIVNASGVDAYGFLAAGIMDVLVIRHKKSSCSLIGEPWPSGGYPSLSSYESGIKG